MSRTVTEPIPQVWTSWPDYGQTDRIYLDMLGTVEELHYSDDFPGGPKALGCRLVVDPTFSHRALAPGRDIGVTVGAEDVWQGELAAPQINDDGSRQITGIGDGDCTVNFVALGTTTHNALNLNEVIDGARASGRHSRFFRTETFAVPSGVSAADGTVTMSDALTRVSTALGKRWRIDRERAIRLYPQDGDGTTYLLRSRRDVDRSTAGVVTRLDGAYIDALTGLYSVEHVDASPADTGGTFYPSFYNAGRTAYATGDFTLYSDGVTTTAYAMQAPATALIMDLSSGQQLTKVATSQFYTQFQGSAAATIGTGGRTATYRASVGGASLGTGTQDGVSHRGTGSLDQTGNIAPHEQIVDLTQQGSFTLAEALGQLDTAIGKLRSHPHYTGSFTAAPGDLLNTGGVPVDLASVRAGCVVTVLVLDPTRNVSLSAQEPQVLIGEVDYDAATNTLTMTPLSDDTVTGDTPRSIDPLTGLAR